MDQADTISHDEVAATDTIDVDLRLFNDEHFHRAPPQHPFDGFASFPRLPAELRLHVWLLLLRRHRMIELGICSQRDEDATMYPGDVSEGAVESLYYTARNHLGNLVSGRDYTLHMKGRGFATTLNPLLWVSSEARQVTLGFYRVHLPFPGQNGGQMLYFNPEYDVFHVQPMQIIRPFATQPFNEACVATILVDFLCDVRAYDPRDQGVVNLALDRCYHYNIFPEDEDILPIAPATLHPAAAASFADILRSKLSSVLFITNFRDRMRGIPETPIASRMAYHFARTFPLHRRGLYAGAFDWLPADPRPGVEFDSRQVAIYEDPRCLVRGWDKMERAFGISKRASRLYICPSLDWQYRPSTDYLAQRDPTPPVWSRTELAHHLNEEAKDWLSKRQFASKCFPGGLNIPKHGTMIDAETFEMLGSAPTTAIGMWLIPTEAFKEPKNPRTNLYNVSAVRPGLFLFDVGE